MVGSTDSAETSSGTLTYLGYKPVEHTEFSLAAVGEGDMLAGMYVGYLVHKYNQQIRENTLNMYLVDQGAHSSS